MPTVTPIKKNDEVFVLRGKDRGKTGRVLIVLPQNKKIVVEGVQMIKRHTRANPQRNVKGGIVEKEAPINISNVALVCSDCGPTRIQRREKEGGQKVRICAKCGKTLDA